MKVLIVSNTNDFRINLLTKAMRTVGEVGFMHKYNPQSLIEYSPDFVISDIPVNHNHVFKLDKLDSLGPFIDLTEFKEPQINSDYVCDAVYLGDIKEFQELLNIHKRGYSLRYYFTNPSGLSCYAGNIVMSKSFELYRNALASPIPKDDIGFREMDIVVSRGNPVRYSPNIIEDIVKAIDGKKFTSQYSRKKILETSTNFDKAIEIVISLGKYRLVQALKEKKKCLLS